tara:strand:+ start:736 stop:1821 length:1086 start_codon:yes stop_codon:yes gene_type:complete
MAYTTINKHTDYFQTELWSAQDTSIDTINFAPDWVWIKSRTNADGHVLFDRVRGANKRLTSAGTAAEATTSDELTAFNSDGYTLGTGDNVNRSGHNYVSWNWRAGTTSGITTTNSTITPTAYSFNQTAGFSIIKYNGNSGGSGYSAKIPHGLGVAPKVVIIKNITSTSGGGEHWTVYHKELSTGHQLYLNLTNTQNDEQNEFYDTEPDTVNFTVGISDRTNNTNHDYIAYCFAEKTGYSKFGRYNGNGASGTNPNVDGTFIYTGFKPKWILIKHAHSGTASGEHWNLQDVKRSTYNPSIVMLSPNQNSADNSTNNNGIDFLSNGFKIRNNDGRLNNSGATYIYMAFGQSLVGSNNVPCTAR